MNNTTTSVYDSEICLQQDINKLRIPRLVIFTIITLATYFGNILILTSLKVFSKQLKGTLYILLGNLAVADLILAIGLTIKIITSIFTSLESNLYLCIIKICVLGVSLTASGILLMFISLDRFCAIVFPMKHLVRSAKSGYRRIKLAVAWMLSVTVICVPVISHFISSLTSSACIPCDLIPRGIALAAAVFIPSQFIINVVLCLIVIWRLRTNTLSVHKCNKSLLKFGLLIKVYVAFAICWSPFVVSTFLKEASTEDPYVTVRFYCLLPGMLNSAMNWIIYGLANKKLRDAFKNVLLCRNKRQLRLSNYLQPKSSDKLDSKISSGEILSCETRETSA